MEPCSECASGRLAVISGDPSKDGLYVVRLKMPANYKIPAHNHPTAEYVTVVSGDFHIGMGDKLDPDKGQVYIMLQLAKSSSGTVGH